MSDKTFTVKWTKNTYSVEAQPTLADFKLKLESLTQVPLDRQKLVCKGKNLDETSYQALPTKSVLMMIGSAAMIKVVDDVKKTSGSQQEQLYLPPGLVNLGNTCWMNATLKALFYVSELRDALVQFAQEHQIKNHANHTCNEAGCVKSPLAAGTPTRDEVALVVAIGNLYQELQRKVDQCRHFDDDDEAFKPVSVVLAISKCYPHLFDITAKDHEQQDADEFLTVLLTTLDKCLITKDATTERFVHLIQELFYLDIQQITEPKDADKLTAEYLATKSETTTTAKDTAGGDDEVKQDDSKMGDDDDNNNNKQKVDISQDTTTEKESQPKLRCTIQQDVLDVKNGLRLALIEELTKRSKLTQKNEQFKRQSFIVKLPKYLIVHLQRFHWKQETQSKAKLIRKVAIDTLLDLYPFCNEQTQQVLHPYRKSFDDLKAEMGVASTTTTTTKTEMTDELTTTTTTTEKTPENIQKYGNVKNGGYYELQSIVTHQGRSADSGHYVAWTKTSAGKGYNEKALTGMTEKEKETLKEQMSTKSFIKHDDTRSSFQPEKILTDLAGGGDFHMAYICIYKSKE